MTEPIIKLNIKTKPMPKTRFNSKNGRACLLATAMALVSLPSLAWNPFGLDDANEKPVAEIDWQLPAAPVDENLLPFYVGKSTRLAFAIDTKSLSVDTDGVIRYTIIGTSASGAKNISYEGIRCSSNEKRIYALGHADGSWVRARDSEWQSIAVKGNNLQHAELAQNYFCKDGQVAGKTAQILQVLRYHRSTMAQP